MQPFKKLKLSKTAKKNKSPTRGKWLDEDTVENVVELIEELLDILDPEEDTEEEDVPEDIVNSTD